MSRDHRKLRAFELADQLVTSVYSETKSFPREELFGLTSQMRRAALSVVLNIVEGAALPSQREYAHHLSIAHGSLRELGYCIELSARFDYLSPKTAHALQSLYDETARVLSGLKRSMQPDRKRI